MWPFKHKRARFDLTDSMPISSADDILRLAEDRLVTAIREAQEERKAAEAKRLEADQSICLMQALLREVQTKRAPKVTTS